MLSPLDELEARTIYILREAHARVEPLGMLWSIGKDSNALLWMARKAFFGRVPFPVTQLDTAMELPEIYEFRDRIVPAWGLDLHVEECPPLESTDAKERVFSPRALDGSWDFRDQPAELWDQYKTDVKPGAHLRIHPLLHWREIDIWRYTKRENIPIVPLYFARDGKRYRSLGEKNITAPIDSNATTIDEIIAEIETTKISERAGRTMDHEAEDAFEHLRSAGYM